MKFGASREGGSSNKNVIRMKSGESVSGILQGDPLEYKRAFKPGEDEKFRFRINLVTKINGVLEAKILEGGWKIYAQIKSLHDSGWNLEETFVKIARQGSGQQDTTYAVTALPERPTAEAIAAVKKIPLKDLSEGLPGSAPRDEQPPAQDCPF